MLLTRHQTVRVYLPSASDLVEVSTGDLFDPLVHYAGLVRDAEELMQFVRGTLD